MQTQLVIDKAGRVVIPKLIRDQLRLAPGDVLELQCSGGRISLRPKQEKMPLQKEHGIWVYRTGSPAPASLEAWVDRVREERLRDLL